VATLRLRRFPDIQALLPPRNAARITFFVALFRLRTVHLAVEPHTRIPTRHDPSTIQNPWRRGFVQQNSFPHPAHSVNPDLGITTIIE
jgi:hypothetical protein